MSINNIEIQDSAGNVYYPHTDASVVKFGDSDVGTSLSENMQNSASHKSEIVSKVILATRTKNTSGIQTITVGFKPKLIKITGTLQRADASKLGYLSLGSCDESLSQYNTYNRGDAYNFFNVGASVVEFDQTSGNGMYATISNITSTSFDLTWYVNGTGISDTTITNARMIIAVSSHY